MTDADPGRPGGVSADFVFGTLATDALRLAELRRASEGVRHAHDLEPADPPPGVPIRIGVTIGPQVLADRVTAYYSTDGSDPAGAGGTAERGLALDLARTGVSWDTLSWAYLETWAGSIPPQSGGTLVRYRIEAWSERTRRGTWATEVAGVVAGERPAGFADAEAIRLASDAPPLWPVTRRGAFAVHVDDERVPDWLRDAIIYEVFVDRFAADGGRPFAEPTTPDGFCGGTLRGVLERLDHIVELGVTCIWLTPVSPSPSHHGYDTTDHAAVEPRLGTDDDVRRLIGAAHARGLRVLLDYAVNHVSSEHPAFRRALADRDGPDARWFTFTRWPDQYLSFFGVQDHPQVDADDPGAQAYLVDSARHWLEMGVDGFRCDYAQGPSHAFWSVFRAATRENHPDSATIGEVVETPALQRTYRGRLDGCLDFILLQALRRFFAFGDITASAFDGFLRRHLEFFGDDAVMPSFLDNHDMNRFLWVVGGDTRRLKLAALCQFTLPHPPIVYYGTEVGLSQRRDVRYADGSGHPEESRLPMPWGSEDDGLLDFYQRLCRLRLSDPELWRGQRQTLVTDDATGVYAYRCRSGTREAVVALNNGDTTQAIRLEGAVGSPPHLVTDGSVTVEGDALSLPARAGAVLLQRRTGMDGG